MSRVPRYAQSTFFNDITAWRRLRLRFDVALEIAVCVSFSPALRQVGGRGRGWRWVELLIDNKRHCCCPVSCICSLSSPPPSLCFYTCSRDKNNLEGRLSWQETATQTTSTGFGGGGLRGGLFSVRVLESSRPALWSRNYLFRLWPRLWHSQSFRLQLVLVDTVYWKSRDNFHDFWKNID